MKSRQIMGRIKNNSGLTLVELMVTIAIVAMVMAIIYPMLTFGMNSFKNGQNTADKQYAIRQTADFLTKQLRYANSISFLTNVPSPSVGRYDIYLENTGVLKYYKSGVTAVIPGVDNVQKFKLTFANVPSSTNSLRFTIGDKDDSKYDITAEVILLNYHLAPPFPTVPSPCIGISYTLPPSS